jgi:hypothetical protein
VNIITEPLRLAIGSHTAGSGKGCAMNVVSWENGDTVITDLPDCSDFLLSRIVQRVNDAYCTHRRWSDPPFLDDLLCARCSVKVLDLAHRTVGTSAHGLSDLDLQRLYVRLACRVAREVVHLARGIEAERAILAAEAWAEKPGCCLPESIRDLGDDALAATGSAEHAAGYAAHAAYDAAIYTTYYNPGFYSVNVAALAADAADAAVEAWTAHKTAAAWLHAVLAVEAKDSVATLAGQERVRRMQFAHLVIDEFYRLTGLVEHTPDPVAVAHAVQQMVGVS